MHVALVFAGLTSIGIFALNVVVTTKTYENDSGDKRLPWLTCALFLNAVNFAFIGGMLIYYFMYVYPVINGR